MPLKHFLKCPAAIIIGWALAGLLTTTPVSAFEAPAVGTIEVGFSPNGGSQALVVKVIDAAKIELRMLAYSFTSAPITAALLRAKKRGVDVQLVVDKKMNVAATGKARAALSALVNVGIDVRVTSVYAAHHDKVIVIDRASVELGSFNYSFAAANSNSENVFVNWCNPALAETYLQHFQRNYERSKPYPMLY